MLEISISDLTSVLLLNGLSQNETKQILRDLLTKTMELEIRRSKNRVQQRFEKLIEDTISEIK